MDILSYLSELLQSRKSIGISGLGTLYKKKVPGRYNAESHSFFPPSFILDFKSEIEEDGVLIDYICAQKDVTEETAVFMIEEFRNGVLAQLNAGEEYVLGSLGKLSMDSGAVKFIAAEVSADGEVAFNLPVMEESADVLKQSDVSVESTLDEGVVEQDTASEIYPEVGAVEEQADMKQADATDALAGLPVVEEYHAELEEENSESTHLAKAEPESPVSSPIPVIETTEDLVEDEVAPLRTEDPAELVSTPVPPMENPVVMEETKSSEIPAEEVPLPRTSINDRFKTEDQLKSEIEALNYYRSKAPLSKPVLTADNEVLLKVQAEKEKAQKLDPEEVAPFYQSEDEVVKGTSWFLKFIYGLLILVIAAGVAYVLQPSLFSKITGDKPGMPHPADPANLPTNPAPVVLDSIKKDSVASTNAPVSNLDSVQKSAVPVVKATDTVTVYEVIGASMHNQKEADAFIALMRKSGIEAKVVTNMAGRRLKMSIGTFKDEATAKQELDKLAKRLKIPGIYIYKNKQK